MYEKQRHVVQCSNISHVSPDSNYVLSETTLVTTFPTHTLSFLSSGSDRSIMCYRYEFSLGHSSNTNCLFDCIVCGETWYRPSIKLSCQSYVIDTLSLCTPYVWESTWFCLFLCVLSQRTVFRIFRQHNTSFRLWFLGKNQVQTVPSTSAIKHS